MMRFSQLFIEQIHTALRLANQVVQGSLTKRQLIEELLSSIIEHTPARWTHYRALDPVRNELFYEGFFGTLEPGKFVLDQRFPIEDENSSIGAWAFHNQQTLYVEDIKLQTKPSFSCQFDKARSCVNSPVAGLRRYGVLTADSDKPHAFEENSIAFIEVIAAIIASVFDVLEAQRSRDEEWRIVGHQILGPLDGLRGYCQLLLEDRYEEQAQRKIVYEGMLSLTERSIMAVRNLSYMVKWLIEGETPALAELSQDVALMNLLIGVARVFQGEARLLGISIHVNNTIEKLGTVRGNEPLLRHAFLNLMDNAVKYSNHNTNIVIEGEISREWKRIAFVNEGIQLKDSDLNQIFERGPASRTQEAQRVYPVGFGLGLWIVNKVIQMHSGKVIAEPTEAGRTKFWVLLPH